MIASMWTRSYGRGLFDICEDIEAVSNVKILGATLHSDGMIEIKYREVDSFSDEEMASLSCILEGASLADSDGF